MTKTFPTVTISAVLCLCQVATAQDHEGVNAIYERMSAAYASLDSVAFSDIYAADGVYLRSGSNPMRVGIDAIIGNYEEFFSDVREGGGRRELLFRIVKRACSETLCSDVGWYKHNRYDSDGKLEGTSYGRFLTTPGKGDDGVWRFFADLDTGAEQQHWESAQQVPGLHFDE